MNTTGCICNLCGCSQNVFRCSRCHRAYYCCKEHQEKDWKVHKVRCRVPSLEEKEADCEPVGNLTVDSSSTDSAAHHQVSVIGTALLNSISESGHEVCDVMPQQATDGRKNSVTDSMGSIRLQSEEEDGRCMQSQESVNKNPPFLHRTPDTYQNEDMLKRSTLERMTQVCQYVVRDLDEYGICVIDNFMGQERGECIRESVTSMYHSGIFIGGETMNSNLKTTKNIRGDKITWVDGTEQTCSEIALLISTVDSIIMSSLRMKENGELSKHQISGRTKAMIACYPASGTHYVKHVDNPNRDGRCITSTYYLNKEWDVKKDGGLLRIFPQGWASQVVDIEPLFDRVIFFWSDRRNPHEVQPAYRTRYAVTLWYFDTKEREEARLRFQRNSALSGLQSKLTASE